MKKFINPSLHKALVSTGLLLLVLTRLAAQIPSGYYDPATGKTGTALQSALHNIIKGHTVKSYDFLWTAFKTTDDKPNGKVWDMYSDIPNGTPNGNPPYVYTFSSDQCGSYSGEGSCYNREHSWPKSWFNDAAPMNSDMFHLYPTDGYVNGMRSNYAYGTVGSATWTSQNGSKVGSCNWPGFSGTAFEPRDEYKGDFARTYFYMSTRYYTEDSGWSSSDMTIKSQLKPWALQMMLHWSTVDPVSQKETDRNNTVYGFQNNRNPFIDHPEYASMIWGNPVGVDELKDGHAILYIYPNPAVDFCRVSIPADQPLSSPSVKIIFLSGKMIEAPYNLTGNLMDIDVRILPEGFYMIQISDQTCNYRARLMKIN